MIESEFQRKVKKEIKELFPTCYVLKADPTDIQGIPDLLILCDDKWAALEVKKSKSASHRPNQDYHVDKMNNMSYAAFIYPENKEEVYDALKRTFGIGR